ncbi:hypothetical protein [Nonomuraea aridisoli]|uniref:Uncharacterized protein n=1 Tax=Nonomuraea aridisoli TaxID=2070368 RepID=A0A2W2DAE5_9ACTN|nr:hypothetical protein [Nonomuraea aridisoli]PZG08916.1 hypothetical protein C1J01_38385 [Nonomuraea aridisoli]
MKLWEMIRDHIAAARAHAGLDKGVSAWTAQQISTRATAQTDKILASARRALGLLDQDSTHLTHVIFLIRGQICGTPPPRWAAVTDFPFDQR